MGGNVTPIPSAIYPGRYNIHTTVNDGGSTPASTVSKGVGSFSVPRSYNKVDNAVRIHEYGHLHMAKNVFDPYFVPSLKGTLNENASQTAMDLLVNGKIQHLGKLAKADGEDDKFQELKHLPFDIPKDMLEKKDRKLGYHYIRALQLGRKKEMKTLAKALPEEIVTLSKLIEEAIRPFHSQHQLTAAHAAQISALFGSLQRMIEPETKEEVEEKKGRKTEDEGGEPSKRAKSPQWGDMTIEVAKLVKHPKLATNRIPKSGFVGVMKRPQNFYTDGRMFSMFKRTDMMAVCIDISGSMAIDMNQLHEVIKKSPMCTIGVYSGSGDAGKLEIIAKGNMLVEKLPTGLGGNIVDGPALRWLASQPGRKIWVSDGMVTGVNDTLHGELTAEAYEIAAMARMERHPNLASLLETFQKDRNRGGR